MNSINRPPLLLAAIIVGLFSMLGAFSIDIYFPSFKEMEIYFSTTPASIQQTLTAYMVPYAIASFFYGPISDAIGRKRLLLISLVVFAVGSAGAALSDSLEGVLFWRGIQGLSAGAGKVLGRAIIRDLYTASDSQKVMAWTSVLFGIAPASAPVIGGWLQLTVGWQGPFWFVALFTIVLVISTAVVFPETHPREKRIPLHVVPLARQCLALLGSTRFVGLSLVLGLGFSPVFLYIASSAAVVMDHWRLGELGFIYFAGPLISGMVAGGLIAGKVAGKFSRESTALVGLWITAASGAAGLLGAFLEVPYFLAVIPIAMMAASSALVFPAVTVDILETAPLARGTASSLSNAISLGIMALVGGLLSPMVSHSPTVLAAVALLLALVACGSWFATRVGKGVPLAEAL
ncbi:MAG: multidrug effflux MFS transporter [Lysobacterales bacterium]